MAINLGVPDAPRLRPQIVVIGVGGAGGNAVNNMIRSHLEGVDFVCANTDAQALLQAQTERRIQLGASFTQGLGAGSRPDIGRAAAEEAMEDIIAHLQGNNMCFIAAGMGGGTGTGAAPVVARAARELDILTVGVVTKPFHFEGSQRMRIAEDGIRELQQYVDTLIVIPNQNLFRIANDKTTFADAFKMADDVLHAGVRGVTDLMVQPGLINLDFADVRTVMAEMGKAMMGTGEAEGERRAIEAAEAAISNPLLDDVSMKGARGVLINITGGYDMTLFEVDEAANRIREEVDSEANIIFGATFDEALEGRMRISLVATGIEAQAAAQDAPFRSQTPRGQTMRPVLVKGGEAAHQGAAPAARAEQASAAHAALSSTGVLESDGPPEPTDPGLIEDAPVVAAPAAMAEPLPVAPLPAPIPAPMPEPVVRPAAARVTETPVQVRPAPVVRPAMPAAPIAPRDPFIPPRPVEPRREMAAAAPAQADERRRVPTLFERMTGTGRARTEPRAPEPQVQARPAPAAEPLRPQQGDRIAVTSYEDVLDIPAFLRRQAN
jgi:cell division protein FtsZ